MEKFIKAIETFTFNPEPGGNILAPSGDLQLKEINAIYNHNVATDEKGNKKLNQFDALYMAYKAGYMRAKGLI